MKFLKEVFAWWTGNTLGTRFTLWKARAKLVGSDEFGNRYYRAEELYPGQGERRFIIYATLSEASLAPPLWHGWLHHMIDVPPSEQERVQRPWEKPHQPNLTGTAAAYRPPGSILSSGQRPPATGDYEAWNPETGSQKPETRK